MSDKNIVMSENKARIVYGSAHSKKLKPSVISPFLREKDENGRVLKVHSDVHLLLRQQNLVQSIGVDAVRQYLGQMLGNQSQTPENLSDEDLFALIPPKEVNNITTVYEYSQYLKEHESDFKARYDKLVDSKRKYDDYMSVYKKAFEK